MKNALETCIEKIQDIANRSENWTEQEFKQQLRVTLGEYYKQHSIEILQHIEEQGVFLEEDVKIGGTD
jgi:hypothetical protein